LNAHLRKRGNFFAIPSGLFQAERMTQPLALVFYDRLLPGSQLVNRLQDLHYRVETLSDAGKLVECAEQSKPMLVLADLDSSRMDILTAISRLKQHAATRHLPVIGFGSDNTPDIQGTAQAAGVTLLVSESAILSHLRECLEQALQVD
jgi:PleD family two-component response regulator